MDTVRRNTTIDWTVKESIRAKLRTLVKRILRKHGYPPTNRTKRLILCLNRQNCCVKMGGIAIFVGFFNSLTVFGGKEKNMASFGLTLSRSCIYRKTFDSLSCLLAVSILTISTCGCSNPYSAYYQDLTNGQQVVGAKNMQPETVDVRVVQGGNVDEDTKGMMREGYIVIGVSAFNAGAVNPQGAKRQAQKVGAEVVIVYNQYTNTVSGVMPFQQPTTQTSTTYHSGSVYGYGGGMATFSGTSQTTTYGSQTTYIPYNVDRYDYLRRIDKSRTDATGGTR